MLSPKPDSWGDILIIVTTSDWLNKHLSDCPRCSTLSRDALPPSVPVGWKGRLNQHLLTAVFLSQRRTRDMKAFCTIAVVGLSLLGSIVSASAQPYGGPGFGYEELDDGYGERGPRYRERDYGYEERGPRSRDRRYAFNEREYLRCNRDVLRAVRRGETESGLAHYQRFGRREGRRLSC
jgi:hypothetical protein